MKRRTTPIKRTQSQDNLLNLHNPKLSHERLTLKKERTKEHEKFQRFIQETILQKQTEAEKLKKQENVQKRKWLENIKLFTQVTLTLGCETAAFATFIIDPARTIFLSEQFPTSLWAGISFMGMAAIMSYNEVREYKKCNQMIERLESVKVAMEKKEKIKKFKSMIENEINVLQWQKGTSVAMISLMAPAGIVSFAKIFTSTPAVALISAAAPYLFLGAISILLMRSIINCATLQTRINNLKAIQSKLGPGTPAGQKLEKNIEMLQAQKAIEWQKVIFATGALFLISSLMVVSVLCPAVAAILIPIACHYVAPVLTALSLNGVIATASKGKYNLASPLNGAIVKASKGKYNLTSPFRWLGNCFSGGKDKNLDKERIPSFSRSCGSLSPVTG